MKSDRITKKTNDWPKLGCGVGLRTEHFDFITREWPSQVDWFEAITENFMDTGGRPLQILEKVRNHYPIGLHGVSLSIGSVDPLNKNYLKKLKTLADRMEPAIISDHLCWTGVDGKNLHDLLPLPFTEEALNHIAKRVSLVQEFLGKQILLENVSTYVTYKHSHMPEWEFLSYIAKRSGCGILLDINNIYVNAVNHKFDPYHYIQSVPVECVGQFHLAGHTNKGQFLFDTHSRPVIEKVWNLYRFAVQRFGQVTTLIEWDADIPEFSGLVKELLKAREIFEEAWRITPNNVIASVGDEVAVTKQSQQNRHSRNAFGGNPPILISDDPQQKHSEMTGLEIASSSLAKLGTPRNDGNPKLVEIENWMKERILPGIKTGKNLKEFEKTLNPQGGQPGKKRLSVYADGYTARMHESLVEAYPAVQRIIGKKSFLKTSFRYAEAFPSHEYNLSMAGKHYAEFLSKSALSKKLPFLPDLARLEWRVAQSFHAFQEKPFDIKTLENLLPEDWENLSFEFQPSVALLASRWPILNIWNARKTPAKKIIIDLVNRPQNLLIYKTGVKVLCELLDKNQFGLLKGLLAGKTLGETFENFKAGADSLPVTEWFADWAAKALITSCNIALTKKKIPLAV